MRDLDEILATGDGSAEKPFHVRSISEEYVVLEHLETTLESQSLVEKDGRRFDVIVCSNGCDYWFDISEISYTGMCSIVVAILFLLLLCVVALIAFLLR